MVLFANAAMFLAGCDQPQTASQRSGTGGSEMVQPSAGAPDRGSNDIASVGQDLAAKAADALDETALKVKVKSALMADRDVRALDIDVEAEKGVVTLAGEVASVEMRKRAIEVAEATPGVIRVVDKLVVKA